MVTYGPWTQDPDYDTVVTWRHDIGATSARRAEFQAYRGFEPYPVKHYTNEERDLPVTDGQAADALASAATGPTTPVGAIPGSVTTRDTSISRDYEIIDLLAGTYYARATAEVGLFPWLVIPGVASAGPSGLSPFYYTPPPLPTGAVGVEFEGDETGVSTWQRAWVAETTTLLAQNRDDSDGDSTYEPVSGGFTTQLWASGGGVDGVLLSITKPVPATTATVTATLDTAPEITSMLTGGSLTLYTETRGFLSPQHPSTPDAASESWRYGWSIDVLHLRWRLRPPRYRWIYDEAYSIAYRRTFPRDDGLAGGAGRTFPPSRALQSSNRIGGGYL